MVYTGQPSRGCATCRKRRIKCDEKTPECGNCSRIKQKCPGYKNQFDLAWRDQTTVAKKGVERGKQKRKAAREAQFQSSGKTGSPRSSSGRDGHDNHGSSSSVSPPSDHSAPFTDDRVAVISCTPSPAALPDGESTRMGSDPYINLTVTPEDQTLTFFLNTYILPQRDPLARRGFLEYLAPFYKNAPMDSPLMLSSLAVASCMLSSKLGVDPDTAFSRAYYLRAVSQMRDQVSKRKGCANDEMLISVLLLQLYEGSIGHLTKKDASHHAHLDGALALIRHRGAHNFKGKLSLAILFYVRSLLIDEAFRSSAPLPRDVKTWSDLVDDAQQIPGVRLDTINLDLANLRSYAYQILALPATNIAIRTSQLEQILATAAGIDRRLNNWQEIVPAHWIPIRVSGEKFISPSIRAAGLYQDYCDHYVNLFLLGLWNKVRMSQIETKNIIVSCLSELPSSSSDPVYLSSAQSGIQTLIDDICASIPYYLGDRTEPGNQGDPVHYPRAPSGVPGQLKPPIPDHYQTGPALGGWSLLAPLATLLRMKVGMREGQRIWIAGQMARTARIYKIGKLPGQG